MIRANVDMGPIRKGDLCMVVEEPVEQPYEYVTVEKIEGFGRQTMRRERFERSFDDVPQSEVEEIVAGWVDELRRYWGIVPEAQE